MMKDGIKDIIKDCKLTNFSDSYENELRTYVAEYLNTHCLPMFKCAMNMLIGKTKEETEYVGKNPILQNYIFYIQQCKLIYKYIGDKYIVSKKTSEATKCIAQFITNSFCLLTSISTLLISNCNQSVITEYRTFYENFIIVSFLKKYPDLVSVYNDHFQMCRCALEKELAKLKNQNPSDEILTLYQSLEDKYGKEFKDDYGWTASKISDRKKRNLETMFSKSGLSVAFSLLYKEACKFTHATAYSVQFKPDFQYVSRFIYGTVKILKKEFEILFEELPMITKDKAVLRIFVILISDNFLYRMDTQTE